MRQTPAFAVLLLFVAGCVSSEGLHVSNGLEVPVGVRNTLSNAFTSVRVYNDHGELVVYGDVALGGSLCRVRPTVELTVQRSEGAPPRCVLIPIVSRGHRRGWFGADFRARLRGEGSGRAKVNLTFRDGQCTSRGYFEVQADESGTLR